MITYAPTDLQITIPVAVALLAFASKDDTRPHLGVGIDRADLCATDGHRLVQFGIPGMPSGDSNKWHGKVWSRAHVETLVKVAKATKATVITLRFEDCLSSAFPPCSQVVPERKLTARRPVGFDPALMEAMVKVTKACQVKGVKLDSLTGELDPIGFTVSGPSMSARVVVMPMRI